ncbi:MAG: class I SAM-dependent DNA methyltransferase [Deltaproteobacteria bacterium]|nr:class I SAM-dependent DNA methyltransferase [Deltaproteobacteria bacterium]
MQVFGLSGVESADGLFFRLDGVLAAEMSAEESGKELPGGLEEASLRLKRRLEKLPAGRVPVLPMASDYERVRVFSPGSLKGSRAFKTTDLHRRLSLFAPLFSAGGGILKPDGGFAGEKAREKATRLRAALEKRGCRGRDLELCLSRVLFCLFAGGSGIFPSGLFYKYVRDSKRDGSDLSFRLARLFGILNTPLGAKGEDAGAPEGLRAFPRLQGSLFEGDPELHDFDGKTLDALAECAAFDWSGISPSLFGSMFQAIMDEKRRRELGAHYTSEEDILKLIGPLFLDELKSELERAGTNPVALGEFRKKLKNMTFLDPACGCGNFLIVTYRELRRLELSALKITKVPKTSIVNAGDSLMVNTGQFHGVEIEDFPCRIARAGMRLTDHLMNMEAAEYFGGVAVFPPENAGVAIRRNALHMDWMKAASGGGGGRLTHILGNPPFAGSRLQTPQQRKSMARVFKDAPEGEVKGWKILDYVCAWYRKAASCMRNTDVECAFVSTSSVSQGEQAAALWKPLIEDFGMEINFCRKTFKWSGEGRGKAAVFCVIIGFSRKTPQKRKFIYSGDERAEAENINPYLVSGPDVFIMTRPSPICRVPPMSVGNQPIDNGRYLFSEREKDEFIQLEPGALKWFRVFLGADEFLNGRRRFCLCLAGCHGGELGRLPEVSKRVDQVRRFRLKSGRLSTLKLAEKPERFQVENMPEERYLAVPRVSSDRRLYIPAAFLPPGIIVSDSMLILPRAGLYHFGILTSATHMAWVRAVCGRLGTCYRYSKDVVYNNFPWPDEDEKLKAEVENAARKVISARRSFSGKTLADLYDPQTTPRALRDAHVTLDEIVMRAYGFAYEFMTEADTAAGLMELHLKKAGESREG